MAEQETRTITHDAFVRVVGLYALAAEHARSLRTLERVIANTLDEPDDGYGYFGHVSDEIFEKSPNPRDVLRRMNIEVEFAQDRPATFTTPPADSMGP